MPPGTLYNAHFVIAREVRSGSEDGTPTFTTSTVIVHGWADELVARELDQMFREQSVGYQDRRMMFACPGDSDIKDSDEGEVIMGGSLSGGSVVGGQSRGQWSVELIRSAPSPRGVFQLEVQLRGVVESG